MLIGGLWHGASWTFVVWGALHGVALCIHKIWMKLFRHNKTYKGTFNVRISPDLHRAISIHAMQNGLSLNQAVEKAISQYVVSTEDSGNSS
jgi:D-alanyl-lipoteichoic acid acyltransferase DltB (MBOAT superfamily)